MGGGIGLSLYGDYRIVNETTKFAMPETAIGFFPDVGGSYFLPRIKKNYGIFLGLTGQILNANEILNLGLGTHYCPQNKSEDLIDQFIETGTIKKFSIPIVAEKSILESIDSILSCFQGNIKNIFENLEKNGSEIAVKYLKIMKKKCPMSLAVTIELLNEGSKKELKQCLEMEYKLSQNMVYRNDFDEGIDSVLISKNNNPMWDPSSINDINTNDVNNLFKLDNESLKI